MKNTPHIAFTVLFSVINNRSVDNAYSNWKVLTRWNYKGFYCLGWPHSQVFFYKEMHGCFARPKKTGHNNEVVVRRGSSVFILLSNKSIHGQIRGLLRLVFPSNKVHWCWSRNKLHCKSAEGYVSVRFCLLAEVQTGKYNVPNYFITLPFNQETLNTVGTFYRCRWLFFYLFFFYFYF